MDKPIEPGPISSEAEKRKHAEAMADYTAWLAENPQPEPKPRGKTVTVKAVDAEEE